MRTQFILLDIIGRMLTLMWDVACAFILYYFGAACFFHGSWWHVLDSAAVASALYLATSTFDVMFEKAARKFDRVERRFAPIPARREFLARAMASVGARTGLPDLAQYGYGYPRDARK